LLYKKSPLGLYFKRYVRRERERERRERETKGRETEILLPQREIKSTI
jgi:hypothetical protein